MHTFVAKIMIAGITGQITEIVRADSTTHARQIIQAKYAGSRIISWVGPTQIR